MFESANGNFDIQKDHINGAGTYVITAGLTNNGILGKTDVDAKIFNKNTITIDMFGFTFFRQFEYKMVTHARVFSLTSLLSITQRQGLFLANAFHFLNKKFGYENMCSWTKVKDEYIQLPTKDNQIDFDFMENFIAELEAERIAELKAYLLATGLSDYELTTEEEKILKDFENLKYREYHIKDLFDIYSYKKRFDANKIKIEKAGHPYIVRTSLNNGLKGYINEDVKFLNDGNSISFGQDTATMFYQEKPYFTGDKIKILKCKSIEFNKIIAMFFISSMSKAFSLFSWGTSSFSVSAIENQKISLPTTKNNQPDYTTMKIFISAIQKLVIKDLVLYADEKLKINK